MSVLEGLLHSRVRTRAVRGISLLLLRLLTCVAPLTFHLLLLYHHSSHRFLCHNPLGFSLRARRNKFPKPRPVQILLELHLKGRQSEQKGSDPARRTQVCGFLLVLHLQLLSSSASSGVGPPAQGEVLCLFRGTGSVFFGWQLVCVWVDRCLTRLWSLHVRSLSHKAFAEVERQRLLRGWGHRRAGGLGAEVLGKSLRQSAGEGLQLRRVQATSSHQLAHLNAAVQIQRQDPERRQRRPVPDFPTGSSLGSIIHITPRTAVVELVERVGLWLKLVPVGVRGIWASAFGLECVDGRMVLGLVLRSQRWALRASLQANPVPEDIQRTHAFDGAEATQRSSDEVARQIGEEHAWSWIH